LALIHGKGPCIHTPHCTYIHHVYMHTYTTYVHVHIHHMYIHTYTTCACIHTSHMNIHTLHMYVRTYIHHICHCQRSHLDLVLVFTNVYCIPQGLYTHFRCSALAVRAHLCTMCIIYACNFVNHGMDLAIFFEMSVVPRRA
jgi:hypothetical protein